MIDCGHAERELVGDDYDDTCPDTCERCNKERPCEEIPGHGYSLHLCEACARAAWHIGELV